MCLVLFFHVALLLQARTHTGTPCPFVSVSNLRAHTSRRRFHSSRPTVFLLDDTAAPANKLQHQDMSDISKNLTFMGLVFLSHFAWNLFSFQCPCVTPDACQKKFDFLTELLVDFKKRRSENLNPLCGAGQLFAPREAAGEMCIPTCPWLAYCLRQYTYVCLHSWHRQAYKLANINWTKLQLEQV